MSTRKVLALALVGLGLAWLWHLEARAPVTAKSTGLRLRARLQGDRPFSGEARVGVAFITEEDRAEWEEFQREGRLGAGPSRLEDLANVSQWLTAPVTPDASGGGTLGSVPVPAAHLYRVLAWEPDGTFYWGELVPEKPPVEGVLDAGVLHATRPTGLKVLLTGGGSARPSERYSLSLSRVVEDTADAERASQLLPAVAQMAPSLAKAYDNDTWLPLSPEHELLLQPLLPDPEVRLQVRSDSGKQSEPVSVRLREGRVEKVVLDLARLFP